MSLPQRIPGLEAVTEPPQSLLMASQEVEKVLVMIWPEKRSCLPEKAEKKDRGEDGEEPGPFVHCTD
jgi:hypothetical protein